MAETCFVKLPTLDDNLRTQPNVTDLLTYTVITKQGKSLETLPAKKKSNQIKNHDVHVLTLNGSVFSNRLCIFSLCCASFSCCLLSSFCAFSTCSSTSAVCNNNTAHYPKEREQLLEREQYTFIVYHKNC